MGSEISEEVFRNWNISVMAIGAVYCLVFLSSLTYNYFYRQLKINKVVISLAIAHITSWLIDFICRMTTYINTKSNLHDNHDTANYIIMAMIIVHPIFFYGLWMFRMYFAFKLSEFKVKPLQFSIVLVLFLVLLIARFIEQASWMLVVAGYSPMIPIERLINCLWTFISFDIVTRLVLVYLFVRKLFRLVMRQTDHSERAYSQSQTDIQTQSQTDIQTQPAPPPSDMELNMQQIKFLGIIKKISLLGICSALPLALSRAIFVIDFVSVDGLFTHKNWLAFNTLQMIAIFIEVLAISLTFKFNETMYWVFCRYCDVGCTKCCDSAKVKRKITHSEKSKELSVNSHISQTGTATATATAMGSVTAPQNGTTSLPNSTKLETKASTTAPISPDIGSDVEMVGGQSD